MTENLMAGANIQFPECIICLTPLQSNLVTPTVCGHVFHEDCLRNWRNKGNNDKCPICKRDSSHTTNLIYDIKYISEDNTNQEPQTLNELLMRKQLLEKKNKKYENEIKELTEFNEKCQKQVEDFVKKVEENTKNMTKYKNEYLSVKYLLDEEKEKNQKYKDTIDKLTNEKNNLENFKKRFELKNDIEQETENIILNKDSEKAQDEFDTQFYKLLNDDDEKKGLREYFYVLQQKILKLTQENEELKKAKKNFFAKEKEKFNFGFDNGSTTFTQYLQISSSSNKRNYTDYMKESKIYEKKNNSHMNGEKNDLNKDREENNINKNNNVINNNQGLSLIIEDNQENNRHINAIKLKKNNNENIGKDFKKLFQNPLKKKDLSFKKNKEFQ